MSEKVCMVTGATAGIGYETVRALAETGMRVVGISRNEKKCAEVQERIREESGNRDVDFLAADLSSQKEIRRLAGDFKSRFDRLDVLVNNAGGFFPTRCVTKDGLEMTFALNHLNYFLLTDLLLERIQSGATARIVNVASDAHRRSVISFDDLESEKQYKGWTAYGMSKLANVLFTYELAERLQGTKVTVNALHPGVVASSFFRSGRFPFLIRFLVNLVCMSPKKGAKTSIYLATSSEVEGISGKYYVKCKAVRSSPRSYDRIAAQTLWKISEERTASK